MTSVYVRKPRNVRSVYARSQTDEPTEPNESPESEGAAPKKPDGRKGRRSSRGKSDGKVTESDRDSVKESLTSSTDGVDKKSKKVDADGDNKNVKNDGDGPSTRAKACEKRRVGRPSRASKASDDATESSLLSAVEDREQERPGKKRPSALRRRASIEASGPAERRISNEVFVTSSTLSQLKRKIKENREVPRATAAKEDSEDGDRSISKLKPFVCGVCQRRYGSKVGLREHEQVHRWDSASDGGSTPPPFKQFVCDVCNKAFRFKSTLTKHRSVHSAVKPYVCTVCGKGFSQEKNLTIHLFGHTGERPFECDSCDKSFLRKFDLDQHRRVHTGERPYVCSVCDKAFIKMDYLKHHRTVHQATPGSRPFQCDRCPKAFAREVCLNAHKRRHAGLRLFECGDCHKKFSTKDVLKKHSRMHARSSPARRKREPVLSPRARAEKERCVCEVCGANICNRSALKLHMKTHTGDRAFICEYCRKSYITKHEWLVHRRSHTGERPFACHICPAAYARNESLVRHIQGYHMDSRPHVCEHCSKAFKDPRHLKDHRLIHLDLKPHKCGRCGKGFRQAGSLRSHMRSHTGERPYPCSRCSKSFADSGARLRHMRIHTGEKPYKCSQCDAEFARPEPFKHHRESVHNDFTVIPLNVVRKPMVKAALLPVSDIVVPASEVIAAGQENSSTQDQDIPSNTPEVCSQSSVSFEPVVPVSVYENEVRVWEQSSAAYASRVMTVLEQSSAGDGDRVASISESQPSTADDGCRVIRVLEHPSTGDGDRIVVVHQQTETYADMVSSSVAGARYDPVVESTVEQHSQSSYIASGQMLGQEHGITLPSTAIVYQTLPSNNELSQSMHYSERTVCSVAPQSFFAAEEFSNGEGSARRVAAKPLSDGALRIDNNAVPAVLEAQVSQGGEGSHQRALGVEYGISFAQPSSLGESGIEAEQEDVALNSPLPEGEPEDFGDTNSRGDVKTEYVEQEGVLVDFGKPETVPDVAEFQADPNSAASATQIFIIGSEGNAENADNATLTVIQSQGTSYHIENATAIAVVDAGTSSSRRPPPGYCQVYRADETGSVTLLNSQTDPSNCAGNQQRAGDSVDTSGARVMEVEGVGTIQIVVGDTNTGVRVCDGNEDSNRDSPVKEEDHLTVSFVPAASHPHPALPPPANTNIRFNKKNKPTSMNMDASAFGDTMNTRKKSAHGQKKRGWICESCGKGFTAKSALKSHLAVIHRIDEDRRFVCDICDKVCVARNVLEEHRRTHTGEKPFVCEVCGNTYKLKSLLRQHILVAHIGRRPYACEVCHKTFTERNSLRDHKLIHQGLKPHKCPTCGKCFTQWGSLSNHKRIHSGVKLACQYCGKQFSDKSSFARHQRIHTGEKPCKCEHCPAAFARSEQLKRHMSREHPGDLQNLATLADAVETLSKE